MPYFGYSRQNSEGGDVAGWSENDEDGKQLLGIMQNAQQEQLKQHAAKTQPTKKGGKSSSSHQHRDIQREHLVRPIEGLDAQSPAGSPDFDAVQSMVRNGITGSKEGQVLVPARITAVRESRQRNSPVEKNRQQSILLQHMQVLESELEKELHRHQTFPAARASHHRTIQMKSKRPSGFRSSSAHELDRFVPPANLVLGIGFSPLIRMQKKGNASAMPDDQRVAARPLSTNSFYQEMRRPRSVHMEVASGQKENGFASGFSHQGSGRETGRNYTTVDAISPRPKHVHRRSLQDKKQILGSDLGDDVIVSQLNTLKKPESSLRTTSNSEHAEKARIVTSDDLDGLRSDEKGQIHRQTDASSTGVSGNLGPFMEHAGSVTPIGSGAPIGSVTPISVEMRMRSQSHEPFRPKSASAIPGPTPLRPITPGKETTTRPVSAAVDTISEVGSEAQPPTSPIPSPLPTVHRHSRTAERRSTQRKGSSERSTTNMPSSTVSQRSSSSSSVGDPSNPFPRALSTVCKTPSTEFSATQSVGSENSFPTMFGAFGGSVPPSIPPHYAGVHQHASIASTFVTVKKCPSTEPVVRRQDASAGKGRTRTPLVDNSTGTARPRYHHRQHQHQQHQHLDQHHAGYFKSEEYQQPHTRRLPSSHTVTTASDHTSQWPFELLPIGDKGMRRGLVSAGEALGLHADAGFKLHFEDMDLQPQLKSLLKHDPDVALQLRLRRQHGAKSNAKSLGRSPSTPPSFGNWPGAGVPTGQVGRSKRSGSAQTPLHDSLSHHGDGPRPVRAQLYFLAGAPNDHLDVSSLEESLSLDADGLVFEPGHSPGHYDLHHHDQHHQKPEEEEDGVEMPAAEAADAAEQSCMALDHSNQPEAHFPGPHAHLRARCSPREQEPLGLEEMGVEGHHVQIPSMPAAHHPAAHAHPRASSDCSPTPEQDSDQCSPTPEQDQLGLEGMGVQGHHVQIPSVRGRHLIIQVAGTGAGMSDAEAHHASDDGDDGTVKSADSAQLEDEG